MLSVNNETVGYLVVLAYACLPAVSGAIADFQVVVEFRTRHLFKDDANKGTNECGYGKKTM